MSLLINNLGYPCIGPQKQLLRGIDRYLLREIGPKRLNGIAREQRRDNWELQKQKGVDLIPSNDFTLHDFVLDHIVLFGAIPERFTWDGGAIDHDLYFRLALGKLSQYDIKERVVRPLDKASWFGTEHSYTVPVFAKDQTFSLSSTKIFEEYIEALSYKIKTKPVLLGPLSFLYLGKEGEPGFSRLALLPKLLPLYQEIIEKLETLGADYVQIEEPILSLALDQDWQEAFQYAYGVLASSKKDVPLILTHYLGGVGSQWDWVRRLPVEVFHLDIVEGRQDLSSILETFPSRAKLSLGLLGGRHIFREEEATVLELLERTHRSLGKDRLWIGPSASLRHLPYSTKYEVKLDPEIRSTLSFAEEKLTALLSLKKALLQKPSSFKT